MLPTTSRLWALAKKPLDLPILTGPDATFRLETEPLPAIQDKQVMVKTLYFPNEPAQRLWIDPNISPDRLYIDPVEIGDTMRSYTCICEVIGTKSPDLAVGAVVIADIGWREFTVLPAEECTPIKPLEGLEPVHYVSLLGVAGVTAYHGLVDVAKVTANETIVISGAAGGVGSLAVQIAKNVIGCKRVVGIAGSDEKCRWVERLGADICLNYKSKDFHEKLTEATQGFVEVYFDNVGGEILDFMLTRVKKDGRIAACGATADYNSGEKSGIKNWYHVIAMRLQIRGFVVLDTIATGRWAEMVQYLIDGYQEGKITPTEEGLTIRDSSFERVPEAWLGLFDGRTHSGKLLTRLV